MKLPPLGRDAEASTGVVVVLDGTSKLPAGGAVLTTDDLPEEIAIAVWAAARGGIWFSERVWLGAFGHTPTAAAIRAGLTPAELKTLRLVGHGYADAQIAAARTVSVTTVRHHLRNLRRKIGAGSRHQLIAIALVTGVASPWSILKTVTNDGAL